MNRSENRRLALERRISFLEKKLKNEDRPGTLDVVGELFLIQNDVIQKLNSVLDDLNKMANVSSEMLHNEELSDDLLDISEYISEALDELNRISID